MRGQAVTRCKRDFSLPLLSATDQRVPWAVAWGVAGRHGNMMSERTPTKSICRTASILFRETLRTLEAVFRRKHWQQRPAKLSLEATLDTRSVTTLPTLGNKSSTRSKSGKKTSFVFAEGMLRYAASKQRWRLRRLRH